MLNAMPLSLLIMGVVFQKWVWLAKLWQTESPLPIHPWLYVIFVLYRPHAVIIIAPAKCHYTNSGVATNEATEATASVKVSALA